MKSNSNSSRNMCCSLPHLPIPNVVVLKYADGQLDTHFIYGSCKDVISTSGYITSNGRMISDMNGEGCGTKWLSFTA
jgi:hypothetical protein